MAQIARIRPSQADLSRSKVPLPVWCGILAGVMASLPSFLPESRSQPFIFRLVHALTPSCVLGSPRDRHQSTRLALYFRFRPSPPRPPSPPPGAGARVRGPGEETAQQAAPAGARFPQLGPRRLVSK